MFNLVKQKLCKIIIKILSFLLVSEKKKESLDEFLSKSTSEDNASFQVIMEKSAIAHQKKYPWLYKDENEEQKKLTDMLALPPSNTEEDRKAELVTWAYKNKNALMYVPDGKINSVFSNRNCFKCNFCA